MQPNHAAPIAPSRDDGSAWAGSDGPGHGHPHVSWQVFPSVFLEVRMVLRYCRICQCAVEASGHIHPQNVCAVCGITKRLDEFPPHPSSLDRHTDTCLQCSAARRGDAHTAGETSRSTAQHDRAVRRARNAVLRACGYHWRRVTGGHDADPDPDHPPAVRWELHAPDGRIVTLDSALAAIGADQGTFAASMPGQPAAPAQTQAAVANGGAVLPSEFYDPQLLVLDTETTGLSPRQSTVIEIAIVRLDGTVVLDTLVRPSPCVVPPEITALTGITARDLTQAAALSELWPQVLAALTNSPTATYNASFDRGFLRAGAERHSLPWPDAAITTVCAMRAYRRFRRWRNPAEASRSWSLASACAAEGIRLDDAHRALADCHATRALIQAMLRQAPPDMRSSAALQHP